jgi:hypothetical protein
VPSDTTVRYLLKLLRAALQAATDEELIECNVGRLVKLRATAGRKIAPLSVQESWAASSFPDRSYSCC